MRASLFWQNPFKYVCFFNKIMGGEAFGPPWAQVWRRRAPRGSQEGSFRAPEGSKWLPRGLISSARGLQVAPKKAELRSKTTKRFKNYTTKQQNNKKATKQLNNKTTKQLNN